MYAADYSVALFEPAQTDLLALWKQNNKQQADAVTYSLCCPFQKRCNMKELALKLNTQNRGAYHHHSNNCQLMLLAI